jgi:hypothetical protein
LEEVQATSLLEIGADRGVHTRLLLEYCEVNGGSLIVVEPNVTDALREILGNARRVSLFAEKSRTALSRIEMAVDAVLLEGDLNYHTVLSDLRAIGSLSERGGKPFPVVFFANASWPYARRDMYYDPEGMSEESRHPYARAGMTPWSAGLEAGMINHPFANAQREGGEKNGVLTAAKDFVSENYGLRLFTLPVNHGLGIMYSEGSVAAAFVERHLAVSVRMRQFLETLELARLNSIVSELSRRVTRQRTSRVQGSMAHLLRQLGRRIIRILER